MTLKKRLLEGNPTKFHFLVFMFLSCVFFFFGRLGYLDCYDMV